mmetsp:Transcript_12248/g.29766  ORF Transcript_12248/g.29766 Transcript_12248/m.29766 type:complete len:246 (+) Transcript_12248:42-779(+)
MLLLESSCCFVAILSPVPACFNMVCRQEEGRGIHPQEEVALRHLARTNCICQKSMQSTAQHSCRIRMLRQAQNRHWCAFVRIVSFSRVVSQNNTVVTRLAGRTTRIVQSIPLGSTHKTPFMATGASNVVATLNFGCNRGTTGTRTSSQCPLGHLGQVLVGRRQHAGKGLARFGCMTLSQEFPGLPTKAAKDKVTLGANHASRIIFGSFVIQVRRWWRGSSSRKVQVFRFHPLTRRRLFRLHGAVP